MNLRFRNASQTSRLEPWTLKHTNGFGSQLIARGQIAKALSVGSVGSVLLDFCIIYASI